ncbi:MAG: putative colanic acid biosynthesis acetyltransferase [Bacteroidales bacterium]|nr:putative colanic acid biosynthesis acetyltransferase [Bacteroidales bacterium]
MKRAVWIVVYMLFFRPFGTPIFNAWRRIILRIFMAKIGKGVVVYSSAKIWAPWNLVMKDGSCLGPHVVCYNQAIIDIGENSVVSQYSFLCTAGHKTSELNNVKTGLVIAPIVIEDKAWVAMRAYVGMGVTIGEGAIVGATASVYKDVAPWTIVGGNPAKFIKVRVLQKN